MELHAAAQVHDMLHAVGARFSRFGKARNNVHFSVELEEPFIKGLCHGLRERVRRVPRVHRSEGARYGDGNFIFGFSCAGR